MEKQLLGKNLDCCSMVVVHLTVKMNTVVPGPVDFGCRTSEY